MVSTADADQAAMAPAGFNWSGFYIGVGGGFGASTSTYKSKYPGNPLWGGQGRFGELTIGYDHMLTDRVLLGGFIDTHLGNIKYSTGLTAPAGISTTDVLTNGYGFDALARLGYVLNDSTLGYILGGYTWERFKLKKTISVPPAINDRRTEQESRGGFVLGAGMETAIGHNWTIKTEYRYSSYGDLGASLLGEVTPSTHTFHIAANYRFDANGTGPAIASPAYDWTGFYIGAAAGAGGGAHKVIQSAAGPTQLETNGYGSDAVSGELDAGYDHDFGKFVAGVMVDGISSMTALQF
jgi:outer membrane immunogenic protein